MALTRLEASGKGARVMLRGTGEARGSRCHSSSLRKGAKGARSRSPTSTQQSRVWRVSGAVTGSCSSPLAASYGEKEASMDSMLSMEGVGWTHQWVQCYQ